MYTLLKLDTSPILYKQTNVKFMHSFSEWMYCVLFRWNVEWGKNIGSCFYFFYLLYTDAWALTVVCRYRSISVVCARENIKQITRQWNVESEIPWNTIMYKFSSSLEPFYDHFWAHLCILHGGLICIAFCPSVCPSVCLSLDNNSYLGKYYSYESETLPQYKALIGAYRKNTYYTLGSIF